MNNVNVVERLSNKVIATYSINLGGFNYTPSQAELFDEAWRCALDDGIVDVQHKSDYTYQVV